MEIYLLHDVENLGKRGDRVHVTKGYFRNYLSPKGLAMLATAGNARRMVDLESVRVRRDKKQLASAEQMAARVNGLRLVFRMQANEEGHLYGSVSEQVIAKELEGKGFKVDLKQVLIDESIKALGDYPVGLALHRNVKAQITVSVVKE